MSRPRVVYSHLGLVASGGISSNVFILGDPDVSVEKWRLGSVRFNWAFLFSGPRGVILVKILTGVLVKHDD